MEEDGQSLQSVFALADSTRQGLESAYDSNNISYQEKVRSAISLYGKCKRLTDRLSLFSSNEVLEDVTSNNLQYLLIPYYLAELTLKITAGDRKNNLKQAQTYFEEYLRSLESYSTLSSEDSKLYEKYLESPGSFSTAGTNDPGTRRARKIARFREEKELKQKLEYLRQEPTALINDESFARKVHLTNLALCTHQTFQALEAISQELQVLALAPEFTREQNDLTQDSREGARELDNGYTERLENARSSIAGGNRGGPLLSKDGKPLQPFTLLDNRQRLQQGVFRPDHSLPTMTIDEYLAEEKRRGGMIEGGGEKSGIRPEPDEDDMRKADEETIKARAWDDFKEENPRGSGNTLNRG